MAQDPTEVMIPTRAKLWLAEPGTTMPVSESAVPGAGWFDVGLTTEDGTQIVTNPTWTEIYAHQSAKPVKKFRTRDPWALDIVLMQFTARNLTAAVGGGVSVEVSSGHYKWSPADEEAGEPTAALLDLVGDEGFLYRLAIPVAQATNAVTIPLNKTAEARLPLHLDILGGDTGDPCFLLTDDPAFDPAA